MKKFIDIIKETEEKNINTPKVISINGYESVYAEVLRQMIPGSLNVLINTFEYGVRSFFRGLIIEKAVRQGEAVACYYPWKQTLSDVRLMMASFLNIPRIEQIYVYDDDSWRRIVKEVKPELFDVPIYVECSETMNVDDIITDIEKKHAELGINTFFIQNL